MNEEFLARARRFLDETPLFDGHNDLPLLIRRRADGDPAAFGLAERRDGRDTDIPRLREGRVAAQIWAAFVPPREARPASFALQQIALVRRFVDAYPDAFMPAFCADDVARAKKRGLIASFVSIENGAAVEDGRLDSLDAYHALGVRLITLCHNLSTDWCDSATDAPRHDGLSPFGVRVVERMNRLGLMVDLSHVSDRAAHKALDACAAPAVWSHSNARKLCGHPRNVSEDLLDRVVANGGVVMATFVPNFLSQKSLDWLTPLQDPHGKDRADAGADGEIARRETEKGVWPRGGLVDLCDHIDYLAHRIGFDHVGVGSDFFGGPQGAGLEDASCFPHIFAELMRRGWRDEDLAKLASGNILRTMRAAQTAAGRRESREEGPATASL
jgi:membrane dipeptidase